jgi:leucyl aminopeptidase
MVELRTEYKELEKVQTGALIYFIPSDDDKRKNEFKKIRSIYRDHIPQIVSKDVKGEAGETSIVYITGGFKTPRIIFTGLGPSDKISAEVIRRAAAVAAKRAETAGIDSVGYIFESLTQYCDPLSISVGELAAAVGEGALLGLYSFDKYSTSVKEKNKKSVKSITLLAPGPDTVKPIRNGSTRASLICDAVILSRDLGNTPGIDLYPETLADRARAECKKAGCKVTVLDERKIAALKMGGLLAVSSGSARPPRFIIIEWLGGRRSDRPYVLVGKGVTFDTGGISIKPSAQMGEMKMDMCGAAAVIGAMKSIASLKLPVNAIGLIPATENMPSGTAVRPGDVIRIMDGKTVEVDNTDAEGRLILADALVFAERYKPKAVVDLATLTGACIVALGHYATGLMSNNIELTRKLIAAGNKTYERVWELPLFDEYEKLIKSDIADVKNLGGRWAGAITAGWFLRKFTGDYPWAHLDIAGTAILEEDSEYQQKGASGVGVRLLTEWLQSEAAV